MCGTDDVLPAGVLPDEVVIVLLEEVLLGVLLEALTVHKAVVLTDLF